MKLRFEFRVFENTLITKLDNFPKVSSFGREWVVNCTVMLVRGFEAGDVSNRYGDNVD